MKNPALLFAIGLLFSPALQAQSCSAQSALVRPTVVELYTSEGCDSCPPAERWLAEFKARRPDVLGAAFHVDYWDRLGWVDRFASPAYTERQRQTLAYSGARFAYTPQVIVNGRDWQRSHDFPRSAGPAAVALSLTRRGDEQVELRLSARANAPARVQLWWAVIEDGHHSDVKAGENRGVHLSHDMVVRDYARLPAGPADQQLSLKFKSADAEGRTHRRRLLVVASDAVAGTVLQAVELSC